MNPSQFGIYLPENLGGKMIDKFPPYHVWSFVTEPFFLKNKILESRI